MYTISKYLNLNKDLNGSLRLIEFISLLMNKYSSTNISMVKHFEYISFESGILFTKYISKGIKQFCKQYRYEISQTPAGKQG